MIRHFFGTVLLMSGKDDGRKPYTARAGIFDLDYLHSYRNDMVRTAKGDA